MNHRPRHQALVSNPPWVTKLLATNWELLEQTAPAAWLPKLDRTEAHGSRLSGRVKEFGCGAFGCVLPTLDSYVVLKVTSDETEAQFAAELANTLPVPICTTYHLVFELPEARRDGRKVYLLWREEAFNVGQVDVVVGQHAEDAIHAQHQAAQMAYLALSHHEDATAALSDWRDSLLAMSGIEELTWLADGMIAAYDHLGIVISDVHGGNLGQVRRDGVDYWVITDPGNVVVIHRPQQNPRDPRVHAGMTPKQIQAEHDRMTSDEMIWKSLTYVGIQEADPDYTDDPENVNLEIRDCPCGSTLARRLKKNPCRCK